MFFIIFIFNYLFNTNKINGFLVVGSNMENAFISCKVDLAMI